MVKWDNYSIIPNSRNDKHFCHNRISRCHNNVKTKYSRFATTGSLGRYSVGVVWYCLCLFVPVFYLLVVFLLRPVYDNAPKFLHNNNVVRAACVCPLFSSLRTFWTHSIKTGNIPAYTYLRSWSCVLRTGRRRLLICSFY